ncbi:helix-turn-helix domain-containing protein [Enterococcus mundtii]|uniref:helix-turn-helix domain-containing protein n=1 Tax=Enterococcus mundtii TaxID=53346 RepID=UPI001CF59810|nr:helix-turn-helix transcriptional regulator [Enterococcus mundtii]MCA6775086.1 helix-turn-helix transcriptional regulator [Enterococcus mundtii]
MTTFDRVKQLADKQKISIVELEEKLGFGRNSLYSWKTKTPNGDRLKKVADYFNVSTDYLLGRKEQKNIDESDATSSQIGGLFRSVSSKEDLNEQEQQELKEDLDWYMRERARLIKERNNRGNYG